VSEVEDLSKTDDEKIANGKLKSVKISENIDAQEFHD